VPLTLTAAQQALLNSRGQCWKVEVWPNPAATGKVYVKNTATGSILATLPVPSGGYPIPWQSSAPDMVNVQLPGAFALDVATNGDGAYVTLWVI